MTIRSVRGGVASVLLLAPVLGCGSGGGTGDDEPPAGVPETLAGWALFADAPAQDSAEDVIPYDVASPLFSDHALKHRFLRLPEGGAIAYDDEARWQLPVGSVLVKTFAFPVDERDPGLGEQLIETRILSHRAEGWKAFTYEWNAAQTEATRLRTGRNVAVRWIGADGGERTVGAYRIPGEATCLRCHGGGSGSETRPLGPSVGMLDIDFDHGAGPVNQIDHLADLGLLEPPPPPIGQRVAFADPEDEGVPAPERARGYLHANCSHCHAPDGETSAKELFLDYASTDPGLGDPADWGVCKLPTSAGNTVGCDQQTYDIVPGSPDDSLLLCRMQITGPGRMPEIGRSVVHDEGIELVRAWIAAMDPGLLGGCGE